jgi:hypothetical protein
MKNKRPPLRGKNRKSKVTIATKMMVDRSTAFQALRAAIGILKEDRP